MKKDRAWSRIALWLVGATAAYNLLEGIIAIAAGITAESIALVGFGLDSFIELAAAAALLWRLHGEWHIYSGDQLEQRDRRVVRFVGLTFFALAAYVFAQAIWTLRGGEKPEESVIGIGLAMVSLVVMPVIAWGKFRAARNIGSPALRAEAKETLACSYLSFVLLLGLAANALAAWWWADPVAALLMVPWLLKEGRECIS